MNHKVTKKKDMDEDDSTRFKIMFTLINKKVPMTLTEIARETKLDKELVFHHLPNLKRDYLIAELPDKKYVCQPFFYDEDIVEDLDNLMKVLIKIMLRELQECVPDENELETAIKNNLELYIKKFAVQIC